MPVDEQEAWEALGAAWRLPSGTGQVAAIERVVAAADAGEWPDLRFAARSLAVTAYQDAGETHKMFVPFAWCVAALDRGEADDRFVHHVMWSFKHIVAHLPKFPEVPLSRTMSVLDDMERRYRAGGHSMHAVHQYRWLIAQHLGDAAQAADQYRLWCAAPRDDLSDCAGCEPTARVEHLADIGADEEAVRLAEPVLAGELSCAEQPQMLLTALLLPYLRTGRYEQAADAHRRAYRAIRSSRAELGPVAQHIEFCARTGNEPRGLELVERHLGWLAAPCDPYAEMRFAASAALLLRRVADAGHGDDELAVPVPGDPAGHGDPARHGGAAGVTVAELAGELAERARTLAARFDQRNGTGHQGRTIAALLDAEPLVPRLPLARAGWGTPVPAPTPPEQAAPEPAAPEPVVTATDPAALADLAERYGREFDEDAEQAAWARFDQVCPEPTGTLAGRRMLARGRARTTELAEAERLWRAAADLLADDPVRRNTATSLAGLARCRLGDPDTGLAELAAARDALAAEPADPEGWQADAVRAAQERVAVGLDAAGRVPEAVEAAREALTWPGGTRRVGLTHARLAFLLARADQPAEALTHATEAVRLLDGRPAEMVAGVRLLRGQLHAQAGDFAAALPEFRAATAAPDEATRADAYRMAGHAALDGDRPEAAVAPLTDAVGLLLGQDRYAEAARARYALADALARTGRFEEAAGVGEDALSGLGTGEDDLGTRLDTLVLLGYVYRELGATAAAVEALDEVARHCAAAGNPAGVGEANGRIATVLDAVDRDAEAAERWSASANAFWVARQDDDLTAEQRATLAAEELSSARNAALSWQWAERTDRALAALPAADDAAAATDPADPRSGWERAMLGYDAGRILAAADRPEEALARTGAAVAGFAELRERGVLDEKPTPVDVAVGTLHGRLLLALGRTADARSVLTALLDRLPAEAEHRRADIAELLAETER